MKKKLVGIAIAAALAPAAAMADMTVYGRVHTSLDSVSGVNATKDTTISLNSNSSRFGIKGSEALDGGMSVLYQLETGVNAAGGGAILAAGERDTFIGVSGGFGTVLAGKLPAANQYVYDSNLFGDQLGDAANFTGTGVPGRATSALHYVLPAMGGASVAVTYVPASALANTAGVALANPGHTFGVKAGLAIGEIKVNAAYFSINADTTNSNGTISPMSIAASMPLGNISLSAQFVSVANESAGTKSSRAIFNVGGKMDMSETTAIKAQFSSAGESNSGAKDGATMVAVGVDYSLSKKTGVYAVFAMATNDTNGNFKMYNWGHNDSNVTGQVGGEDPSGFGVGLTHNF